MRCDTVSIVVPVFQGARFLARALESIRQQSLPATEVVVVDDGSTDGSGEIARAESIDWPALSVIQQENRGPSAARNAGADATSGDLLAFLDADDRMAPGRLAMQAGHLASHPAIDVVVGCEWIELEPGATPPDWLRGLPPARPNPYVMSMMVRRSAWERVGGFDPGLRLAEDTDWLSRATAAGVGIAFVDDVLVMRRLHGANLTQHLSLEAVRGTLASVMRARIAERRRDAARG